MRIIFLFIFFFISAATCFSQTCVIAKVSYRNKDTSIIVGADTKFGLYTFNIQKNTIDTTYTHGPKIFNRGKITYVTIGYGAGIQRRVADSLCKLNLYTNQITYGYLGQFIDDYIAQVKKQLLADLADTKKRAPLLYHRIVGKNMSIVSSTVLIYYVGRYPALLHLLFLVKDPLHIDVQYLWGDVAAGGELDAIQADLNNDKTWSGDAMATIRKMLKAEAIARPDKVGPPFDFCIVHKNKVEMQRQKY